MTEIEQELIEKISHLDSDKQRQLLDFVRSLEESMAALPYSAHELMKLPLHERNRIVGEALERSANEDTELFEANGEADFDDE